MILVLLLLQQISSDMSVAAVSHRCDNEPMLRHNTFLQNLYSFVYELHHPTESTAKNLGDNMPEE